MAQTIRTFIAIELDAATQDALAQLQSQLKRQPGSNAVRWVAPGNIHLTLKFLGDVDAKKISALQNSVAAACAGTPPFTLKLSGVGAFPNPQRANVVWVGIQGDVDVAAALAKKIEDACAELGFAREARAFSPHLTLGRVKRDAGPRARAEIAQMIASAPTRDLGQYRAASVSVMQSDLKPGGSVYSRLAEIKLTEDATTDDAVPRPR